MPQELFPNPHGVLTFKRKTQTKSVECWLPNQSVGWFKPDVDSVLNLQVPLQKILMRCFCQFVARPVALQIIKQLRFTFTPKSKHEFVPHDQVFPSVVIYCSLLLLSCLVSCQFYPKEPFWTAFTCLLSILRNSQLESDVCYLP